MARVKQKECGKCGNKRPMTAQFFKGSGSSLDGFGKNCRDCAGRPVPDSTRRKMEKAGTWLDEKVEEKPPKTKKPKAKKKRGAKKKTAVQAAFDHANGQGPITDLIERMKFAGINSIKIDGQMVTWTEVHEETIG